MPATRMPVARSQRSSTSANSATKIGTEPFRTPASDDEIHCWPTVISVIGDGDLDEPGHHQRRR